LFLFSQVTIINSVNQVEHENNVYSVTMATLLKKFVRGQCVICHNILVVTCAFLIGSFNKKMATCKGKLLSYV